MDHRKVSLILGGTKGLGAALASQLASRGDYVIRVGRSAKIYLAEDNSAEMRCDLRSSEKTMEFLDTLYHSPFKKIDRFFWVAGQLLKGQFAEQQYEAVANAIDVNLRNPLLVARYVWATMLMHPHIHKQFVVVSSSSGIKPRQDEAVYVATKHAQVGFTRSLGLENQDSNLRVSLVLPGGMQTEFWNNNPTNDFDQFLDPTKVADKIIETVTLQTESYFELEIPRGSL